MVNEENDDLHLPVPKFEPGPIHQELRLNYDIRRYERLEPPDVTLDVTILKNMQLDIFSMVFDEIFKPKQQETDTQENTSKETVFQQIQSDRDLPLENKPLARTDFKDYTEILTNSFDDICVDPLFLHPVDKSEPKKVYDLIPSCKNRKDILILNSNSSDFDLHGEMNVIRYKNDVAEIVQIGEDKFNTTPTNYDDYLLLEVVDGSIEFSEVAACLNLKMMKTNKKP